MKLFVKPFKLEEKVNNKEMDHLLESRGIDSNYTMLTIFSAIASICVAIMLISSLISPAVAANRSVYVFGILAAAAIYITTQFCYRHWRKGIMLLVYLSVALFFMYGISIAIFTTPERETVTFNVLLIFIPLLFVDKPRRMNLFVTIFDVLFIILCLNVKTGFVRLADTLNAGIFGFLSLLSTYYMMNIKLRGFALEERLVRMGSYDTLTDLKNRNCFEEELQTYPDRCKNLLNCFYMDSNGLHELNNSKGHKAGDEMLKTVARLIVTTFGEESTYRVGGDEFIIFLPDIPEEEAATRMKEMVKAVNKEGYSVSWGLESVAKETLDMNEIIKRAEQRMYRAKAHFYSRAEHDRRRRAH